MLPAVIFARLFPGDSAAPQRFIDLQHHARHQARWKSVHFALPLIDTTALRVRPAQRPALQQLLTLCRQRAVQRVLVSNVGDLANSRRDFAQLVEELTQLGVSIYLHQLNLETIEDGQPNEAVLVVIRMLAEMARSEQTEHRDLILAGLAAAKQRGTQLGRPVGSTQDRETYLKKYPKVVRQLRKGRSLRQTAKLCHVAEKTVARVKALL